MLNDYSTHLPILKLICENIKPVSIFEYGMGYYSTQLFNEHCKKVYSVEMQDENWFNTITNLNYQNVKFYCLLGEKDAIKFFNILNTNFSIVFVDGHGSNRWECINEAFGKTDIIVTHDTETPGYKWNLVNKPEDYVWIDVIEYNPWTSVLTRDKNMVELLQKNFKVIIRT
jgi:hypothetical protein